MRNTLQLFIALILFLNIATGANGAHQVNGLINGTVKLVLQLNSSHPVTEVYWKYVWGFKTYIIAKITDSKPEFNGDQFKNHLEMFKDGKELHIKNLKYIDSGNYIAMLTLKNNSLVKESFTVRIYEPVPAPSIRTHDDNSSRCNRTVSCDVPANTTDLFYEWGFRYRGSDYQTFNSTNNTIQISQHPEWVNEVLCTVWNPADSRNVSVQLEPCDPKGSPRQSRWPLVLPVLFCLILATVVYIFNKKEELKHSVSKTHHTLSSPVQCSDQEPEFVGSGNSVNYSNLKFISVH